MKNDAAGATGWCSNGRTGLRPCARRDYERIAVSLQQIHYLVFVGLILAKATSRDLLSSP